MNKHVDDFEFDLNTEKLCEMMAEELRREYEEMRKEDAKNAR
ncbi:hypothetical protein [Paenibacillus sp. UNC451MF]|nr:hypothetical protein [Paenibacillus sp. UNC451MF]